MAPKLTFLGAAGTVTGSRYLLENDGRRILVDCGLFQGYKTLRLRNWAALPFAASSIDAVVLTHAHIDHSGYLPKLCQAGFNGPIHCTPGTAALLNILLPDSGHLQEEDAKRANRYGYTRHKPAMPLYTEAEARDSLKQVRTQEFAESFEVVAGISAAFARTGHIIGAASARIVIGGKSVTFTGDVGRINDPIMNPPERLSACDYLVTESTYGDRLHPEGDVREVLASIVRETAAKGGTVVVPAFAVGRAQHLLHIVERLKADNAIPDIPVYLDSPMAISATELFCENAGDHKLSNQSCQSMCDGTQYARTPEDSKAIDLSEGPKIVISASGMITGGRILHHLKRFLPEDKNTVLFVGFQAAGTRGRTLVDGADEVKIHGRYVPVRARIVQAQGLSAHGDYREMLSWLETSDIHPRKVFVTHGEPAASDAFRRRLHERFGWDVVVPDDGSAWDL